MSTTSSDFEPLGGSNLEQAVIRRICQPVLDQVPRSVHPNTISILNHLVCWISAVLAYLSTRYSGIGRTLFLAGASVGTFSGMVGDCLDGMQARRTNRCSKLGELLDHWLDAMAVPLVTFGLTAALQLEPWVAAAVHVTNAMIYNSQLVLYHHTGKFVHPGTTGVDAQLSVSIGYLVAGGFFLVFDRSTRWVDILLLVIGILAIVFQMRLNCFYYKRLRGLILRHLRFVMLCGSCAALFLLGVIDHLAFLLLVVFLSFRITGGYVQATILKLRFNGFDWVIALGLLGMAAVHYLLPAQRLLGIPVQPLLPYLASLYLVGRNLVEFAQWFPELRPARSHD